MTDAEIKKREIQSAPECAKWMVANQQPANFDGLLARKSTLFKLIDYRDDASVFTAIAYGSTNTTCWTHTEANHIYALNRVAGPCFDEFGGIFRTKRFTIPKMLYPLTVFGSHRHSDGPTEEALQRGQASGEIYQGTILSQYHNGFERGICCRQGNAG